MTGAVQAITGGGIAGIPTGGSQGGTDTLTHNVSCAWNNNGVFTLVLGATPANFNWVNPASVAIAAQFQIFFHTSAGALSAGSDAQDTWLDLSTSRTLLKNSGAPSTVSGTYSIREKATQIVRVNAAAWSMTI